MEKGKTNNPNGRPKGKPNRITTDLREFLRQLLSDNICQFKKDFKNLEPRDRLIIMEKLLSYILPKLSSVTVNDENPDPTILKTREDFLRQMRREEEGKSDERSDGQIPK